MSTDETPSSELGRSHDSVTAFGRSVGTRTLAAVVAVTLVALSLRLFALGTRVFHWDEARVGYWILRYAENGIWEYHASIHGPFLYHVNKYLFQLFGASDFLARLPVAIVSGLLPLTAWLFRERLDRAEMLTVGLFFALNPLLLYYSRFMRNDVLLAAFMVYALAFYVRLFDTHKPRYLYAGTLMLALAFTTKENVLVYVVTWLGAAVLLLEHRLLLVGGEDDRVALLRKWGSDLWHARRWWLHLALGLAFFFAVVIFFYAPRARGVPGPGLWKAFTNPGMFPAVVEEATVGSWEKFASKWGEGNQNSFLGTFKALWKPTQQGALPLLVLALVGFFVDRYDGPRPRDLVAFTFYWGFVSLVGYPVIVENPFPWEPIHAVVPLVIPAGVGLAVFVRWAAQAIGDSDGVSATLATLLVLLVVGQMAATAVTTSFVHPQDEYLDDGQTDVNTLVQYGQPADGIRPTLELVGEVARQNDGTDVLYYGSDFYVADESDNDRWAAGGGWYNRLPIPWYTEHADAVVESAADPSQLSGDVPPVVIARASDSHVLDRRLSNYRAYEHELTIHGSRTVFYVHEDALPSDAPPATDGGGGDSNDESS
ncbi:flippase activity-associated protein Agl23 [Halorussus halophilus]|uniref:flippase activity-associated protein Agl23 n=1 Tax=Halorussus halophilus TaxID=2650975 RepID=UPI0013017D65|nr:flippase activity-associated protein Agl23 [Halorussus halophilus]